MPPSPREEEPKAGAPEWMCTFSDMMSLLLCFFILLFALASVEEMKFSQNMAFIQGSFGRIPGLSTMSHVPPINITPTNAQPTMDKRVAERALEAISKDAKEKLVSDEKTRQVQIRGVEEGVRFDIQGEILFKSGSAEIPAASATAILDPILRIVAGFPNRIRIEGYTDNVWGEGNPHFYKDNFDLAAARAYNVLKYMEDHPDPALRIAHNRLSFESYGPNHPVASNDTPEGRSQNRRVSIVLLEAFKSEGYEGELNMPENPPREAPIEEVMPSRQ